MRRVNGLQSETRADRRMERGKRKEDIQFSSPKRKFDYSLPLLCGDLYVFEITEEDNRSHQLQTTVNYQRRAFNCVRSDLPLNTQLGE